MQYKQNGGSVTGDGGIISIDPTMLQNVLQNFNTNFSLTLDKITGPFKAMSTALEGVAKAFQRLEMYHEFRGEIGMSVNISNKDAIITAVTEGITPVMQELITQTVEQGIDDYMENKAQ